MKSIHRKHDNKYFYKYMSADIAKIILITKRIRFSSPILFNDPFDNVHILKMPGSYEKIQTEISDEIAAMIAGEKPLPKWSSSNLTALFEFTNSLSDEQRHKLASELRKHEEHEIKENPETLGELQAIWIDMLPRSRILCLSEKSDSAVMWSHYARNYTGVMIRFECVDLYDSPLLLARKVKYDDTFPLFGTMDYWVKQITGQTEFDYERTFAELELTKTTEWSYEKEWRVISFEKDSEELYSDYQLHPRTISAVYCGFNIDQQDRSDILRLGEHDLSHVGFYDTIIDQENRRIDYRRINTT